MVVGEKNDYQTIIIHKIILLITGLEFIKLKFVFLFSNLNIN